ncbi:hypothetical protein [Arenibaculum pallidiluteum]|uniref:hypothetical protein n=1 Tax=Arenibaculum pallidiluteum TaxID=2812559 RepID=UPI001A97521A|nr:hypothetical protein [Arenibaculum pallidiluteum]
MKTFSYALIATALLASAPAMADDGNIGVNQFHGSDTLASYAAEPEHVSPVQEAIRQAAAEAPSVGGADSVPVQAETAFGGTDFDMTNAN